MGSRRQQCTKRGEQHCVCTRSSLVVSHANRRCFMWTLARTRRGRPRGWPRIFHPGTRGGGAPRHGMKSGEERVATAPRLHRQ